MPEKSTPLPRNLRSLFPYLHKYRPRILAALILVTANSATSLLPAMVLKFAVDAMGKRLSTHTLVLYGALIVAAACVKGLVAFGMRWCTLSLSREVECGLRQQLFDHLLRLSPSYFDRAMTGDLMSRLFSDVKLVSALLGPALQQAGNTITVSAVVIVLMLAVDAHLTVVVLSPLPLITLFSWYIGGKIHDRSNQTQEALSHISIRLQENLSGVRVLRAFEQEGRELEKLRDLSRKYMDQNLRLAALWGLFNPTLNLFMGLSLVAVLWLGGLRVASGAMTLGALVAFSALVVMLTWPLASVGGVITIVQRGLASLARLDHILEQPVAYDDSVVAQEKTASFGRIEFRNLTFQYGEIPALSAIDLRIEPGQTIGIVGPTGSGKSTLVHLLLRLYEAPADTILLDGVPLTKISMTTLRSQIAFVPQESILFSDTLLANLLFGAPDASAQQVQEALQISQLAADIETFAAGLQTAVGERGVTLSGGQKQRACLARALLRNVPLLILDDALSNVDAETEVRILQGLRRAKQGRTTILISHRIASMALADRVVVLDRGRMVEEGTHAGLLARNGPYAEMYRRQQIESALEMEEAG